MLKRFFETKLIPVLRGIHRRCHTHTFRCFLIVLAVVIVSAAVIWSAWRNVDTDLTLAADQAAALYAQSIDKLKAENNLYYQAEGNITFSSDTIAVEESFSQLITLEELNTLYPKICVEENRQIGKADITRYAFFADGKEFLSIQNANFQTDISLADFSAMFTPYALIDPGIYTEITGISTKTESTIHFATATAVEAWIGDGVTLVSAEGNAHLNQNHALTDCYYLVTYKLNNITITAQYTVKIKDTDFSPIQLPDASNFTVIQNIDAPYLLERACGYLMSATNIQSEYTDRITCEAFGDIRTQAFRLDISNTDEWSAQIDTTVSASNISKTGTTISTKLEQFSQNTYTASVDGGEIAENPDVDKESMINYCENLLIGTIMHPQYITSFEASESDTNYTITFQADEAFAQLLAEEACTTLYQSATILKDMASNSTTDTVSCYLTIDKILGFPIESGFQYQGTYTISDLPYKLTFAADQTYSYQ